MLKPDVSCIPSLSGPSPPLSASLKLKTGILLVTVGHLTAHGTTDPLSQLRRPQCRTMYSTHKIQYYPHLLGCYVTTSAVLYGPWNEKSDW